MKRNYRRRTLITHKKIQSRFILFFVLASALGSSLSVYLFNRISGAKIESMLYSMHIPRTFVSEILFNGMLLSYLLSLFLVIAAFLLATRIVFARLSHPLTRIAADLRKMKEGHLNQRIKVRHKDEFGDFAGLINTMAEETSHRFARIAGHAHQLMDLAAGKQETRQDIADLVARLDHHVAFLEKEMGSLKR